MARPKKPVSAKQVEALAKIGATNQEIADVCDCSVDTLDRRFADALKKGRSNLKTSLRRKQIAVANKGSVPMLIWLGKQLLGQTDKQEISGPDGGPIQTELANKPIGEWTDEELAAESERLDALAAGKNRTRKKA